jgi:acyl-coenzyme A synthetase/AMP-(fatty) acid ligase
LSKGCVARLVAHAGTVLRDRDDAVDLAALARGTCLGGDAGVVAGRSVLVTAKAQMASAVALVELDGLARRITIAPPDISADHLAAVIEDAAIEVVVTDDASPPPRDLPRVTITLPIVPAPAVPREHDTEWVMMTSGTSGRPKLVAHTLDALTGAIDGPPPGVDQPIWSTFYDIRRYGGLQIFLRALLGRTDLVLTSEGEPLVDHLARLAACGVSAISGTPSHWRRVLMSHERDRFSPGYIRLSGEIADQMVLDGLRASFPNAHIGHAYASTEAGVGFAVDDGLEGFPADWLERPPAHVALRVAEGSLRIRSARAASRYLGGTASPLTDLDGFVDTGDLVERRGDRFVFVGRRGGIINVGGMKVNPEEVEAAINSHRDVRMSLVRARKSPLTGALVVADVVLRDPERPTEGLEQQILETCRKRLERHKVPAMVRFVAKLPLTASGKLSRAQVGVQ